MTQDDCVRVFREESQRVIRLAVERGYVVPGTIDELRKEKRNTSSFLISGIISLFS